MLGTANLAATLHEPAYAKQPVSHIKSWQPELQRSCMEQDISTMQWRCLLLMCYFSLFQQKQPMNNLAALTASGAGREGAGSKEPGCRAE